MDHAPFIWAAYSVSAVVLAWVAIAPLFRQRQAVRAAQLAKRRKEAMNDADS